MRLCRNVFLHEFAFRQFQDDEPRIVEVLKYGSQPDEFPSRTKALATSLAPESRAHSIAEE